MRHQGRLIAGEWICLCLILSLLTACAPAYTIREAPSRPLRTGVQNTTAPPSETTAAITTSTDPPRLAGHPEYQKDAGRLPLEKIRENFRTVIADLDLEEAKIGVCFQDFSTGGIWGLAVDQAFNAASIIKLPAAMYSYEMVAAGRGLLEDTVTIEEADLELGTGPISAAGEGLTYTLEELLAANVMHSDNTAFHAIDRYWRGRSPLGWLILDLDSRYGLHYDGTQDITAKECLGFLEELYRNPQGIPGYEQLVFYMENTSFPAMAATYLPVPVARKYGKLNGLYHDVGIVFADRPFAFAILTEGLPLPQETIAQLALAFYQAISEEPIPTEAS